ERLEKSKEKSYRNILSMWWQHWNVRSGLYHAIGRGHHFERHPLGWTPKSPLEQVIGITRVSKFLNAAFLPDDQVFTLALFIFSFSRANNLALLQSSIHDIWTRKQSSTQETRMRYTATDSFETLPYPDTTE